MLFQFLYARLDHLIYFPLNRLRLQFTGLDDRYGVAYRDHYTYIPTYILSHLSIFKRWEIVCRDNAFAFDSFRDLSSAHTHTHTVDTEKSANIVASCMGTNVPSRRKKSPNSFVSIYKYNSLWTTKWAKESNNCFIIIKLYSFPNFQPFSLYRPYGYVVLKSTSLKYDSSHGAKLA